MRTIVDLPDTQVEALKRLSDEAHLSRAELMRRAVAEYLSRHQPVKNGDVSFGLWKKRKRDGVEYQQELRAEWDR